MVIDFDEKKFQREILNLLYPFGLSKPKADQVVSYALLAVRNSSIPVRYRR
ncbi:hypothetical protein SATMO3_57130 [Sporomusa aerivorans]